MIFTIKVMSYYKTLNNMSECIMKSLLQEEVMYVKKADYRGI